MFNLVEHSNKAFKFKQRLDFKRYILLSIYSVYNVLPGTIYIQGVPKTIEITYC